MALLSSNLSRSALTATYAYDVTFGIDIADRANQLVESFSNPTEISAEEIVPGFVLSLAGILTALRSLTQIEDVMALGMRLSRSKRSHLDCRQSYNLSFLLQMSAIALKSRC